MRGLGTSFASLGLFALVGLAGCLPQSGGGGGGACVVGRAVACACTDGTDGTQTCLADQTYGPCVCG
ncbi:MAG: hypothetical protein KC583_19890, partial [Myxococcales bacterium]|nr:hypothetical protein [Myxococcales bacterium]